MTDKQPIPNDLRWYVWERDNFTCRYCGSRRFLSIDHLVAESRGGHMTPDNLITACSGCNSSKGSKTAAAFVAHFPGHRWAWGRTDYDREIQDYRDRAQAMWDTANVLQCERDYRYEYRSDSTEDVGLRWERRFVHDINVLLQSPIFLDGRVAKRLIDCDHDEIVEWKLDVERRWLREQEHSLILGNLAKKTAPHPGRSIGELLKEGLLS